MDFAELAIIVPENEEAWMGDTPAWKLPLAALMVFMACSPDVGAQFQGRWLDGEGVPGLNYQGWTMVNWDRDGA